MNILCYAKAKSGDPDGAIKELSKSVQRSARKWKILLSPQVMDAISQEVKYFDSLTNCSLYENQTQSKCINSSSFKSCTMCAPKKSR